MTVGPSSKLPNLRVALGTLNLPFVSQAMVVLGTPELAPSHAPYSENFPLKTFPHRNPTPSWFSPFRLSCQRFSVPTFKAGTNIFLFFPPAAAKCQLRATPSLPGTWEGREKSWFNSFHAGILNVRKSWVQPVFLVPLSQTEPETER